MVTKYVNQPLGMGICGAPSRKEWIASAIGAGVSVASSLFGGLFSSSAAKEAERQRRIAEQKERAWYLRRYNEDYLDTNAGQNLVRRAEDIFRKGVKQTTGAAKVAGGTDASVAMAKEALNKGVGDTIANVAANDTARKAQVDNIHMQNEQKFAQQRQQEQLAKANEITKAAQGASNAIMSVAGAVDQASAKAPNLNGGSNNSKVVTKISTSTPVSDGTNPFVRDGVEINPLTGEPFEV